MITLENKYLQVSISEQGAEMHSLISKVTGIEHLWQADPAIWPWHAPNLFPVVGSSQNDQILVNDHAYPIGRHGFARNTKFSVLQSSDDHAVFSISDTPDTLSHYPYKFEYQIIYDLVDKRLRVSFKVINHQDRPLYFALGAHPAFRVPFFPDEKYEDYFVEFADPAPTRIHLLNKEGIFNGETREAPVINNRIHLTRTLFDNDALVMKEVKSRKVTITSRKNPCFVEIDFPEFPFLGVWAKSGGDFVCIEPWLGYADAKGPETEFSAREAIHKLEQGHVFEASFFISFGKK